jgi:hypothetical protein
MTFCRHFSARWHLSNRYRTGVEGFRHNEGRIPHNRFLYPRDSRSVRARKRWFRLSEVTVSSHSPIMNAQWTCNNPFHVRPLSTIPAKADHRGTL